MAAAGLATAGALYLLHESGFTGWVRDRVEELSIDDLPVEMRHRLFKVRAWRSSLSPAQAAQWMGAGVLGRGGLRSLVPNHFSPQLEQALAEAMKGGPAVHRNELAWLEGAQGGAALWSAVPALIDVATSGNTLRVPTQLAQEKGIAEGGEVRFSLVGRIFTAQATIDDGSDGEETSRALGIPLAAIHQLLSERVSVIAI